MASRPDDNHTITAAGLALLLARLDPDTDRAALAYERLRRTLIRFFDWRGIWPPDECADETIDRLALRLEDETTIQDPQSYAYGIARMVLLERRRRPAFDSLEAAPDTVSEPTPQDEERERLRDALDRCLAEMPADSQSLLLRYYEGEQHAKIVNRHRLAATLGLSEGALRSRVQRLRDRLEQCLERCLERQ